MNLKISINSNIGKSDRGNIDNFLFLDLNSSEYIKGNAKDDFSTSREISDIGDGVLLAVTNGVGGRSNAKVGSQLAVEFVLEWFLKKRNNKKGVENLPLKQLFTAVKYADKQLLKKRKSESDNFPLETGSAGFTGIIIKGTKLYHTHLGENRLYLIRNKKIYQITKDQSFMQCLVDVGQVTEDEAQYCTSPGILWYILGDEDRFYRGAETLTVDLQNDDILLLSTVGLYEYRLQWTDYGLRNEDILQIILENKKDLSKASQKLTNKLNSLKDFRFSITTILARIQGNDLPKSRQKDPVIESIPLGLLKNKRDETQASG